MVSFIFTGMNFCYLIGDVMVSMLATSVIDHGFDPRSGQTKKTVILLFVASALSTQH